MNTLGCPIVGALKQIMKMNAIKDCPVTVYDIILAKISLIAAQEEMVTLICHSWRQSPEISNFEHVILFMLEKQQTIAK